MALGQEASGAWGRNGQAQVCTGTYAGTGSIPSYKPSNSTKKVIFPCFIPHKPAPRARMHEATGLKPDHKL
jgi:hypothetical protein